MSTTRSSSRAVQLTNLEYSLIAEQLGEIGFASEVFNCSAGLPAALEVLMRWHAGP